MPELEQIYAAGYMDKCAEMGVDPEQLIKQAIPGAGMLGALKGVAGRGAELLTGSRAATMGKNLVGLNEGYKAVAPFAPSSTVERIGRRMSNIRSQMNEEKLKVLLSRLGLGAGVAGVGAGIGGVAAHKKQERTPQNIVAKLRSLIGR